MAKIKNPNDRRFEGQTANFFRQYTRKKQHNHDPNDRHYDHKLERVLMRMKAEDFDRFLHGTEPEEN